MVPHVDATHCDGKPSAVQSLAGTMFRNVYEIPEFVRTLCTRCFRCCVARAIFQTVLLKAALLKKQLFQRGVLIAAS